MRGKLLVTARGGLEGEIRVHDLQTRMLRQCIAIPPREAGRVEAGSVAVAADGSLWVADAAACQLRRFSAFGAELGAIGLAPSRSRPRDRRGLPERVRGVAIDGSERLWVSSGDRPRVHGLQIFEASGRFVASVAAFGERDALYGPPYAVRAFGGRIWLADTGNQCLQQFREDGGFVGRYLLEARCRGARQPIDCAPFGAGIAVLFLEPEPRVFQLDAELEHAEPLVLGGGRLQLPSGLAAAPGGGLFVADHEGQRILELAHDGSPLGVAFG